MKNPARWMRPSSPFTGASRADLAMLRTLAGAVARWETAARNDRYYTLPYAHQLLHNDGGLHQASVLQDFQDRAWDRLSNLPQWESIYEAHRVAGLRRHDPQAYEVHKLRQELSAHVAACRCTA